MYHHTALTLVASFALHLSVATWPTKESEKKLISDLMQSYDKRVILKGLTNDTLLFVFDTGLLQLNNVDMKAQIMDGVYYMLQQCTDEELTWNPADYGESHSLTFPEDTIWMPMIRSVNDVDIAVSERSHLTAFLRVMFDGSVIHNYVVGIKSSCSIWLRCFPFDQQNCTLTLTQIEHMMWEMNITTRYEMKLDHYLGCNSYEILDSVTNLEVLSDRLGTVLLYLRWK